VIEPQDADELQPETREEDIVVLIDEAIANGRADLAELLDRVHAYQELRDICVRVGQELGRPVSLDDVIAHVESDEVARAHVMSLGERIGGEEGFDG
jgi:hypothetical protein